MWGADECDAALQVDLEKQHSKSTATAASVSTEHVVSKMDNVVGAKQNTSTSKKK